jgi:hypothetical protein
MSRLLEARNGERPMDPVVSDAIPPRRDYPRQSAVQVRGTVRARFPSFPVGVNDAIPYPL